MFDRYAAATAPSWGRRALTLASILVHVTAGIALLVYSICRIEEVPPPPLALTFWKLPKPSPPPAGSPRTKESSHSKTPTVVPTTKLAVVVAASEQQDPQQASGDTAGEASGPEGAPGGVPDGEPGGEPAEHVSPPPPPKTMPMFVLMASAVSAPDPHLTDEFKNAHAGQSVGGAYRVCLAADGHVTSVSVVASVPSMDELITAHIKSTWQFKPQALPVCFTKPFRFNIR